MNTNVIAHDRGTYLVESSRVPEQFYLVDLTGSRPRCDCDHGRRCHNDRIPSNCRHVRLARLFAKTQA